MRRFSETQVLPQTIIAPSSDNCVGNVDKTSPIVQGKTNHYTPINNIVTNVSNLFAPYFGLVVTPGKDNQTLRVYCTQFTSEEVIWKVLTYKVDGHTSLYDYVSSQGLNHVRCVFIGGVYVVYFYSTDINGQVDPALFEPNAQNVGNCTSDPNNPMSDLRTEYNNNVCCSLDSDNEMFDLIKEDFEHPCFYGGEIDLEDPTVRAIRDILRMKDKVKATGEFVKTISPNLHLPDNYYFKAVKDKDGLESIALRKKFTRRRPFGNSIDCVKSIVNLFNDAGDGIWVGVFDKKDDLDKEERELIDNLLSYIQAQPTDDPCIWGLKQPIDDDTNESLNSNESTIVESKEDKNTYIVLGTTDDGDLVFDIFDTKDEADKAIQKYMKENPMNKDTFKSQEK